MYIILCIHIRIIRAKKVYWTWCYKLKSRSAFNMSTHDVCVCVYLSNIKMFTTNESDKKEQEEEKYEVRGQIFIDDRNFPPIYDPMSNGNYFLGVSHNIIISYNNNNNNI